MQNGRVVHLALPLVLALLLAAPARAAEHERITIPQDAVAHVTIDEELTSETAQVGQEVTATLAEVDLSGLPTGTRFHGRVTRVQRATATEPGILEIRWHAVTLPNPERHAIEGTTASLGPEDTWYDEEGRLMANPNNNEFEPIWVGYGAAAGAVLATVFDGNILTGALLGGLGGAVYAAIRGGVFGSDHPGDAQRLASSQLTVTRPTFIRHATLFRHDPFGIRFRRPLTFARHPSFFFPHRPTVFRSPFFFPTRTGLFGTTFVRIDGRPVRFFHHRPIFFGGRPFLPFSSLAHGAGFGFRHPAGLGTFQLATPRGTLTGRAGQSFVRFGGEQQSAVRDAPVLMNGEIFVTPRFLSETLGWETTWDPRGMEMEIRTRP